MMRWTCCPACRSEIDIRATRCRWCCTGLERVPAGSLGVVVGLVWAVVGFVQGGVIGIFLGAMIEAIFNVPYITMIAGVLFAVAYSADRYWLGSTRLRERGSALGAPGALYIAEEIKVVDLRRG